MRRLAYKRIVVSIGIAGWLVVAGCATDVIGGKPKVPLSDKSGISRVFMTSDSQVEIAITNAFSNYKYKWMTLWEARVWPDVIAGVHLSEGFVLTYGDLDGIAKVPLDTDRKKWVPYLAEIHITASSINSNKTKVTVRSIHPRVVDGKKPGWHFGEAAHFRSVPPIRQEEEGVLEQIEKFLPNIADR